MMEFIKIIWDESDEINEDMNSLDSGVEDLGDEKYRSYCEKTYQIIKNINEIGLPKKNEQLRLVTFKSFNAVVFLAHIVGLEKVDEIIIVAYSINFEAGRLINQLVNLGKIKKATILLSNIRNTAYREKEEIMKTIFIKNKNIDLFYCHSHAKIMSMKTSEGNYYTIEGSGNLTFNSRVEQYSVDNSQGLYEFTKEWVSKIKIYLHGKKELVLT